MAMKGLYLPASAPWASDLKSELLRFPTGVHDDQVDALGLIGQLLDHVFVPRKPELEPKPPPRRDWFDDEDDDPAMNWRVA